MSAGFDLTGKVAIVTGAAGLLGRQHCDALAEAGAEVVALDLDAAACERLAGELARRRGSAAIGCGADITRADDLRRVRERVLSRFGRIDVLVNNAALDDKLPAAAAGEPASLAERSRFENYPVESFRRSLEVNVVGTFQACQVLGAAMAQRRSGSIINVASTYGLVAPDQRMYRAPDGSQSFYKSAAYPAGKGALIAFTRFLAAYWAEAGVRVNALCPGGVFAGQPEHFVEAYSARTPLGRMAAPADYRGALVLLASDASSYMTGASLVVDGGFTIW